MFNQVGEQGFAELLARRLRTTGGSAAPAVAPELFPVLALESDRIEWGWLKGERHATAFTSRAADAANVSQSSLFNPAGSNTIIVLQRVIIIAAGSHGMNFVTAQLVTTGVTMPRDTRWRFPSLTTNTTAIASTGIIGAATTLNRFYQSNAGSSTNVAVELGIVLTPGFGVMVENFAVNQALGVQYFWYERPAQPGELG